MSLREYHKGLADTYKLLATLFMDVPDEDLLEELRNTFDLGEGESLMEITEDFTSLFYGFDSPISPYESAQMADTDGIGTIWSSITEDVMDAYERAGLVIDEAVSLPPDHIGIELLFISYLIENGRLEELREFLDRHIMKWVPRFLERIKERARTSFYKEIASITMECLYNDYEELTR